jgi:dolichyl-diphosphooligosaccharide--protein glycosyltransferase
MSNWRGQLEDESGVAALTAWLGEYYHYVTLVLLAAFMLWNRAKDWGAYYVDGEILFPGNDPWYHYRSTSYVVRHFPETMPFDPYTYFSYGTANSQFGTIYDQLIATGALVVGLGSPSEEVIRQTLLFAPVVFGVATVVPAYLMGRRLGRSRLAGLTAGAVVAFASGALLAKGVAGTADHQIAEGLFQALAVVGMMVAIAVATEEKPVFELVENREWGALRRPVGWSVLGGFAVGLYLWVWPPGILLLGILGVFFLVHLSAEVVRGNSPEPVAMAGVVAMVTAGVMNVATVSSLSFAAASNSLLQPGMAFGLAVWCVFMAWLARVWERRDVAGAAYPVATFGVLAAGIVAVAVVLPDLFGSLLTQVLKVLGFMFPQSITVGTVGEAQPLRDLAALYDWYGFAVVFALAGVAMILYRYVFTDESRGEGLLVVILMAFLLSAVLTQSRFAYYLTIPIAALAAVPVGAVFRWIGKTRDVDSGVEMYQVLTVLMVLLLVVAPLFLVAGGPIRSASAASGTGGGIDGWESSLDWLGDETPAVGQYNNSGGETLDLYGRYAQQEDFDYPAGSYGVMSWWDYGHWITAKGERIPVANPFQQGASTAARFLLAQNGSEANAVLDTVDESDAATKYVMIDWKMASSYGVVGGKYFAPPAFHPEFQESDLFSRVYLQNRTQIGLPYINRHTQAYYRSMTTRLYRYHGSAMDPRPVVLDWREQQGRTQGGEDVTFEVATPGQPLLRGFDNLSAARAYVAEDGTAQVGGIGPYPSERVAALEHYRLVQQSDTSALEGGYLSALQQTFLGADVTQYLKSQPLYSRMNDRQLQQFGILNWLQKTQPAWTKTFERVPGADLTGTGPANTTVTASVQMRSLTTNETFRYEQHAETGPDGAFEMTLPYSTTGYDQWGPENGHTNVSVRATGPYTISTPGSSNGTHYVSYTATANVSEGAVNGESDETVQVELTKSTQQLIQPNGNDGGSGSGGDGATDGDGGSTDGNSTSDGQGRLAAPDAVEATAARTLTG